jgi:hypothetical protein
MLAQGQDRETIAAAVRVTLHIEWAPLEFGLCWGATLTAVGLHLRSLGHDADGPGASAAPRS